MHDNDAIFIEFVLIYFVGSDDVDNDVAASSQAWASAPQAKRDVIMNRPRKGNTRGRKCCNVKER